MDVFFNIRFYLIVTFHNCSICDLHNNNNNNLCKTWRRWCDGLLLKWSISKKDSMCHWFAMLTIYKFQCVSVGFQCCLSLRPWTTSHSPSLLAFNRDPYITKMIFNIFYLAVSPLEITRLYLPEHKENRRKTRVFSILWELNYLEWFDYTIHWQAMDIRFHEQSK